MASDRAASVPSDRAASDADSVLLNHSVSAPLNPSDLAASDRAADDLSALFKLADRVVSDADFVLLSQAVSAPLNPVDRAAPDPVLVPFNISDPTPVPVNPSDPAADRVSVPLNSSDRAADLDPAAPVSPKVPWAYYALCVMRASIPVQERADEEQSRAVRAGEKAHAKATVAAEVQAAAEIAGKAADKAALKAAAKAGVAAELKAAAEMAGRAADRAAGKAAKRAAVAAEAAEEAKKAWLEANEKVGKLVAKDESVTSTLSMIVEMVEESEKGAKEARVVAEAAKVMAFATLSATKPACPDGTTLAAPGPKLWDTSAVPDRTPRPALELKPASSFSRVTRSKNVSAPDCTPLPTPAPKPASSISRVTKSKNVGAVSEVLMLGDEDGVEHKGEWKEIELRNWCIGVMAGENMTQVAERVGRTRGGCEAIVRRKSGQIRHIMQKYFANRTVPEKYRVDALLVEDEKEVKKVGKGKA